MSFEIPIKGYFLVTVISIDSKVPVLEQILYRKVVIVFKVWIRPRYSVSSVECRMSKCLEYRVSCHD